MPHHIHKPAFPLSEYVERIERIENSGLPPSRQRVYPSAAMVLLIHLKNPTAGYFLDNELHSIRTPLLAGPYSRSFHIDPSEFTAVIIVRFRPGAARVFFPVAAHELHNTDIALSDLHPGEADRLLNDVCTATGEHAQFTVVERYLTRKLQGAAPVHPAVRYAIEKLSHEGAVHSLRHIQLETSLSHTRLIQLFREHVGFTPKLFHRIRRFQSVLDRLQKGLPVNWAELAPECGYYDQAHLIRDFRAFAGITPREYGRVMPYSDNGLLEAGRKG
jgi:AraC-like DNA-binding protein